MSKIAFKTLKLIVDDRKNELVHSNKPKTEAKKSNVISLGTARFTDNPS